MLDLPMGCQGPRRQIRIVLGAAVPLAESLPVSEILYHHPEAVGLHGVAPYRVTGLEYHTHCLSHIVVQPNLVK